jgi:hypothetical protein
LNKYVKLKNKIMEKAFYPQDYVTLGRKHQTTRLNESETFEMLNIINDCFIALEEAKNRYEIAKRDLSIRMKELLEKKTRLPKTDSKAGE